MKKVILLLAVSFTATCIFAQVDSTVVTNVSNIGISALFSVIGKYILAHAIWFTLGAAVVSEILAAIKIPQNSIWQIFVWFVKAFLNAIAKLLGNSKNI